MKGILFPKQRRSFVMTSYGLVTIPYDRYMDLRKLYPSDAPNFDRFFVANLPLMWRSCNGAGAVGGLPQDERPAENIPPFWNMSILLYSKGDGTEEVVRKHMTHDIVVRACKMIKWTASRTAPAEDRKAHAAMRFTHPADWLMTLCIIIANSAKPLRDAITGGDDSIHDEIKKLDPSVK